MAGIFVSYRRSDAGGWAGRLRDTLRQLLSGTRVFMDVDDIPPGVEFADHIAAAVGACDVLLALIGPAWASEANAERLRDPEDFVRLEILAALERRVRVIPTRVGDAALPAREALPAELNGLLRRQDYVISDRSWDDDCRRLAAAVRPLLNPAQSETTTPPPASPANPWSRRLMLTGGAAGLAGLAYWASSFLPLRRPDGATDLAAAPAPSAAAASAAPPPWAAFFELRLAGTWLARATVDGTVDKGSARVAIEQSDQTLQINVLGKDDGTSVPFATIRAVPGGLTFDGPMRVTLQAAGAPEDWVVEMFERRRTGGDKEVYDRVAEGKARIDAGFRRWNAAVTVTGKNYSLDLDGTLDAPAGRLTAQMSERGAKTEFSLVRL